MRYFYYTDFTTTKLLGLYTFGCQFCVEQNAPSEVSEGAEYSFYLLLLFFIEYNTASISSASLLALLYCTEPFSVLPQINISDLDPLDKYILIYMPSMVVVDFVDAVAAPTTAPTAPNKTPPIIARPVAPCCSVFIVSPFSTYM